MNYRNSKLKVQSSKNVEVANQAILEASPSLDSLEPVQELAAMLLRDGEADLVAPPWDLLERTTIFGEMIVRFTRTVPRNPTNDRLINQLTGAGTSVGANYCEANECVSPKDFRFSISRCMKEAKEARFFLRMVVASEPQLATEARPLYREAHELLKIFGSMRHKRVET